MNITPKWQQSDMFLSTKLKMHVYLVILLKKKYNHAWFGWVSGKIGRLYIFENFI